MSRMPEAGRWREAVPVALLAAGASGLRQNYLLPIAVLLVLEYGRPIARSLTLRPLRVDTAAVARAGTTAGLLVLFLLSWWAMSLRWTGTFLFPYLGGHFNPEYTFFEPLKRFEELHYLWQNATYCLPIKAVPLFLIAALGSSRVRRTAALHHFVLAAFVGFALLLRAYPEADPPNLGRYYFGFTFAAFLAIALETVTVDRGRARTESVAALALVVTAISLQIYGDREATSQAFDKALTQIQPAIENPPAWMPPERDANYAKLQDAIPAGSPIAVMVDEAGKLDFRRNRIENLDMVGAVSPPPGLPLHEGAEAVADYLVAKGYRYAIVVHADAAKYLYRRDTWQKNLGPGAPLVWQRTAHQYLEAFDTFDDLLKSRVHLADAGSMTAMDLARRAN
jgi:hypothetical protein